MKRRIILILLALSLILFTACSGIASESREALEDSLYVHFIDVGQGDSIFIELPGGDTMLIDAGVSDSGEVIEKYIRDCGYDYITHLVATHPHADHIGGMAYIVDNFDIKNVYMPKAQADTRTFERLLEAIQNAGLKIKTAKAGVSILDEENLTADIVAPNGEPTDLNNTSAVILLTYGDTSFLFTGDAEEESEKAITADIRADVLKVGHHGSHTSTSDKFLSRVSPKYAVISCGEGNSYGHPHDETIEKLEASGAVILRTDVNGSITFISDGANLEVYADYQ